MNLVIIFSSEEKHFHSASRVKLQNYRRFRFLYYKWVKIRYDIEHYFSGKSDSKLKMFYDKAVQ